MSSRMYECTKPEFVWTGIARIQLLTKNDPLMMMWSYEFFKLLVTSMAANHTYEEMSARAHKLAVVLAGGKFCTKQEAMNALDVAHEAIQLIASNFIEQHADDKPDRDNPSRVARPSAN